jgi:Tol biopolymer transport system component
MSRRPVVSLVVFAFAATSFSCLAADRVLFARLGPSEATLFVSIANSSGERALTQPGSLNYKSSRSKDWIVFTSERGESADLYRTHPDGSGLERLTDDPAAFSPDGKQIVFVSTRASGRANLCILGIATRKGATCGASPSTEVFAAVPNGRRTART